MTAGPISPPSHCSLSPVLLDFGTVMSLLSPSLVAESMEAGYPGERSLVPEIDPTREQIATLVAKLLCEVAKIPADRIAETATVTDDLRMESLAFVEMLVLLEDQYEIEIDPVRVVELNELGAIIDYIYETTLGAR